VNSTAGLAENIQWDESSWVAICDWKS
jgi:hypothetical protein